MRHFLLAFVLTFALAPTPARAEDGYDLWLRYAPIDNVSLRDAYRRAIAGVIVEQSPATAAIVSQELARGLTALLGVPVPPRTTVDRDGLLIVGTIAAPVMATLGWRDELTRLGPDGLCHSLRDAERPPRADRRIGGRQRRAVRRPSISCG